jgi:hypothetical protein
MATPEQIQELRNNISEQTDANPWSDTFLGALIDAYGMDEASAKGWEQKAASIADMTDISEGGSTRKSAHAQYLKMAERYRSNMNTDPESPALRAPRTREAVRQ